MKYIVDFLQFMTFFVPIFVTYGLYNVINNNCGPSAGFCERYKFWQFHNFLRIVFFIIMIGISLEYYRFLFEVLTIN